MRIFLFFCFWSVLFSFFHSGLILASEVNLALGKTYSLYPRPTYSHCTDPDDKIQLTDGMTTQNYFWTQLGTVGWQNVPYAVITVDLGRIESIGRFEFTTAAGTAGVIFPQAVFVHVSDDGQTFRKAAELIGDDFFVNGPLPEKYAIRCLKSRPVETRGRFARFLILSSGPFTFCDEIRVFSGEKPAEKILPAGPALGSAEEVFKAERLNLCLAKRFRDDFSGICAAIAASGIPADVKTALRGRAEEILERAPAGFNSLPLDFKAILPIGAEHSELYQVQAELWKADGCAPLTFARSGIWDFPDRFQSPKGLPAPDISVTAMRNETRPAVFSVFNATQKRQNVQLEISGLETAADVTVHRVLWTETHVCVPVPCALPEIQAEIQENSARIFSIPAEPGLVQQIWLSFKTKKDIFTENELKAKGKKTFSGKILCRCPEVAVEEAFPVELTVYPMIFPEQTKLMLGGWDYSNGNGAYNVNELNRPAFQRHLQERHVNAPWGRSGMLMNCRRNPDGSFTLDTAEFDDWIRQWPTERVREYFIFMGLGGWSSKVTARKFMGAEAGTEEFREVVKEWLGAWRKHWEKLGISTDRINFLLHDEPNESMEDLSAFLEWTSLIREVCPGLKVWEDPCYSDLSKAPKEFFEACAVLCPNRPMWLRDAKTFDEFYLAQRKAGRELDLYSCSGPQRLLDPYAYCLLQAWDAARIGARSSFFWAMGDGGGVTSWNEYFLGRNSYAPFFIDPNDPNVTAGRHMEAIALSAQDFEYVDLLRKKIESLKPHHAARAENMARELDSLIRGVLAPLDGAANVKAALEWKTERDRTLADTARIRILEMLLE